MHRYMSGMHSIQSPTQTQTSQTITNRRCAKLGEMAEHFLSSESEERYEEPDGRGGQAYVPTHKDEDIAQGGITLNIYQKLIEVRKSVPYLQKENKGYQFNYVSSSQVLAGLKSKMDDMGLLLIPSVTNKSVIADIYEKVDGKNNVKRTVDYFTELEMVFAWVNAEKPDEKIECKWYGQGVDTAGEKGVGKALTYAEKYFMLKFFNIPTDKDDPDSFQSKQDDGPPEPKSPPKQAQPNYPIQGISEAQVKRAYAIANKSGIPKDDVIKWIRTAYHKDDIEMLTKAQYDKLCEAMEKGAK